jgi:xylan 1,4-beta-xylosidase
MRRLILFILVCFTSISAFTQKKAIKKNKLPERVINVDFNKEEGPLNNMFKECVVAGRAKPI